MDERFPETSWTLLAKAQQQCEDGARAREVFAGRYYRPVREFLMVVVQDAERAQDLSQEFFSKLCGPGGILEYATREKGRFHNLLKEALRHLVIDEYRRNQVEGARKLYPDQAGEKAWEVLELCKLPAAEAVFHREWVKLKLAAALTEVRAVCLKRGQAVHLELFEKRYLSEQDRPPSWAELGAPFHLDERTARERADTVARHFRLVLRRMLRNEIAVPGGARVTEAEIDHEIRALLSPMD